MDVLVCHLVDSNAVLATLRERIMTLATGAGTIYTGTASWTNDSKMK